MSEPLAPSGGRHNDKMSRYRVSPSAYMIAQHLSPRTGAADDHALLGNPPMASALFSSLRSHPPDAAQISSRICAIVILDRPNLSLPFSWFQHLLWQRCLLCHKL